MVKLEEAKARTENCAIKKMPLPAKVYIPLSQHLGKACQPQVKIGEQVLTGQKIGTAEANVYAPVHASLSGKVVLIEDWPHPLLGRGKTIGIESDGKDQLITSYQLPVTSYDVEKLTPPEIRNIVFEAGVVGMGGAGFPTQIKLNPPKPVDTLIVNGAECEPYLTGDYRIMIEKTNEIILGIKLAAKCLGVKKVYIAIEDNKSEVIRAFNYELRVTSYELRILKSQYPQGGEKQLIKNILGREVPSGKLPFDIGAVVHNVATILAIYEAVYFKKPLYERVVTVAGSCLSAPKNLLVRLGTPIRELIDYCGPLIDQPAKIILGGPMMGIAQYTDSVPVIKTTTGIILFNQQEARAQEELFCIRCGACVRECPVGLMPCLINLAAEKEFWAQAGDYGALDCIECGLCNYVCPANRRLVQSIKIAKLTLNR